MDQSISTRQPETLKKNMMSCSFPPTNVNSSFPLRKLLRKTDEAREHGNVGNCKKQMSQLQTNLMEIFET